VRFPFGYASDGAWNPPRLEQKQVFLHALFGTDAGREPPALALSEASAEWLQDLRPGQRRVPEAERIKATVAQITICYSFPLPQPHS
jgi:hypothetical protein